MLDWLAICLVTMLMFLQVRVAAKAAGVPRKLPEPASGLIQVLSVPGLGMGENRTVDAGEPFIVRLLAILARWDIVDSSTGTTRLGQSAATIQTETDEPPYIPTSTSVRAGGRADYRNEDLSFRDLTGFDFSQAILVGADLSGSNLSRAVLSGAVLIDANLSNAQLSRANAMSALLLRANLSGADLSWANLSGADLSESVLTEAVLIGVTWSSMTVWPGSMRGEIERRSRQIGPDTWQVVPVEANDRAVLI